MQKLNQYFDRVALLVLGALVVVFGAALAQTKAAVTELSHKSPVVKEVVVTPTASPSATLAPTKATVRYQAVPVKPVAK
jgi:hypothetical protein